MEHPHPVAPNPNDQVLELPARLDLAAADSLLEALDERRDQPLNILASGVTHVGTPCIQTLLAAKYQWHRDNRSFHLIDLSSTMRDALTLLGLDDEFLEQ